MTGTVVFRLILERRSPAPVLFVCAGGYGVIVESVDDAVILLLDGYAVRASADKEPMIRCALAAQSSD